MQRFLLVFSAVLLLITLGEIVYLFVPPNTIESKIENKINLPTPSPKLDDDINYLLRTIPRQKLFNVLNLASITKHSTTVSSVLDSLYEGEIIEIVRTPNPRPFSRQVKYKISSGKESFIMYFVKEELNYVTVFKREEKGETQTSIDELKVGSRVSISQQFNIKANHHIKTRILIL